MRHFGFLWSLALGLRVANPAEIQVCTEGELRSALKSGGEIRFKCDTHIELTNPLKIEQNLVLDGGTNQVTLSGGGEVRVFEIANEVSFTLKNINVVDGTHQGAHAYKDGTGAIVHATEGYGGALAATNAVILIQSCVFSNNSATGGDGGGGEFSPNFSAEPAGAAGGAIFTEASHLGDHQLWFRNESRDVRSRESLQSINQLFGRGGSSTRGDSTDGRFDL